ncbi:hypothetical protein SS05631_a45830 (plasmid) [Sinorhizobium sp. CCBAU 05631]|nr:hypothetical protein SS05631_a45830 [Sinorhizobium sp. CCBAU 05631]
MNFVKRYVVAETLSDRYDWCKTRGTWLEVCWQPAFVQIVDESLYVSSRHS